MSAYNRGGGFGFPEGSFDAYGERVRSPDLPVDRGAKLLRRYTSPTSWACGALVHVDECPLVWGDGSIRGALAEDHAGCRTGHEVVINPSFLVEP